MLLSHLLPRRADGAPRGDAATSIGTITNPDITGLTADSRAVRPGHLFAALPGAKVDGRAFIPQAIANGARAVLAPSGTTPPDGAQGVTFIEDPDPRALFARMAATWHAPQPGVVVAVTGTNGKTSTAQFARQIWATLGQRAASLGTLGLIGPGINKYGAMTTPDPVSLHRDLADAAAQGVTHLAMEASSHGLDQRRLDGVRLMAGGFTNLTRDHLDYHGDMETYFQAKAGLFDRLLPAGSAAVLNADAPEFTALNTIARARGLKVISYGLAKPAFTPDLAVLDIQPTGHGQTLRLTVFGEPHQVELPLAGRFQAANALCALGLVIGAGGVDTRSAVAALAALDGVPGRLQLVGTTATGAPVLVDYAHTPDALETVLKALRPHAEGRLVCVFGCGGDRDPGKRPVMGALAGRLADHAIVTDDNPRTEDAAAIRRAVLAGHPGLEEIADRRHAIRAAVAGLAAGDVLVVAGKGHESGQIIGAEVHPFDDADEVRQAIEIARANAAFSSASS